MLVGAYRQLSRMKAGQILVRRRVERGHMRLALGIINLLFILLCMDFDRGKQSP